MNGSRVKWRNPGKEYRTPLHPGVVAIEKGGVETPSTTVANFTYTLGSNKGFSLRFRVGSHV